MSQETIGYYQKTRKVVVCELNVATKGWAIAVEAPPGAGASWFYLTSNLELRDEFPKKGFDSRETAIELYERYLAKLEALETCPECRGTKVYTGLLTVEPCRTCQNLKDKENQ